MTQYAVSQRMEATQTDTTGGKKYEGEDKGKRSSTQSMIQVPATRSSQSQQYQPRSGHTTTANMLQCIENLQAEGRRIIAEKNRRYAGDGDPYMNFRLHGAYGLVVRINDKVSRLSNLLKPGTQIDEAHNESIDDTIMDLMNYAAILAAYRIGSGD